MYPYSPALLLPFLSLLLFTLVLGDIVGIGSSSEFCLFGLEFDQWWVVETVLMFMILDSYPVGCFVPYSLVSSGSSGGG